MGEPDVNPMPGSARDVVAGPPRRVQREFKISKIMKKKSMGFLSLRLQEYSEILECAICSDTYEPPCKVSVLSCNKLHFFHPDCINSWVDHCKGRGLKPSCPICRQEIQTNKIVFQQFKGFTEEALQIHEEEL